MRFLILAFVMLSSGWAYAQQCSVGKGIQICVGDTVYICELPRPCAPLKAVALETKYTDWGQPHEVVYTSPGNPHFPWYSRSKLAKDVRTCRLLCSGERIPYPSTDGGGRTCTSTRRCGAREHCVGGRCMVQNFRNECRPANPCAAGEQCVRGVCIP